MGRRGWGLAAARVAVWVAAAAAGLAVSDASSDSSIAQRDGEELVGGLIVMVLLSCAGGIVYVREVRTWWGTVLGGIGVVAAFAGYLGWVGVQGEHSGMAGVLIVGAPLASLAPVLAVVAWERLSAHPSRVASGHRGRPPRSQAW